MKMNLFAEAAMNATSVRTTPNLYGNVEVRESDYHIAHAEALNLALGMAGAVRLHAESMDPIIERLGLMGAFLYSEAEGGFFKRILDALIKLFEKVKNFFAALLGRFKSNKSYREDLAIIQSAISSETHEYTDKAELSVPKHRWEALGEIVRRVLRKDSIVFTEKYGDKNKTISDVVDSAKGLISILESDKPDRIGGIGKFNAIDSPLKAIQTEYATVDAWVKYIYETATKGINTGDANFGKNSPKTAQESINALWSNEKETIKGNDIKAKKSGSYLESFCLAILTLDVDKVIPALEEGETFFKDKADELKTNLNDLDKVSKRVSENNDTNAVTKEVAQKASSLASVYSTVITNYSTMVITVFNTSKGIFEKMLSEGKKVVADLDKVRKEQGNVSSK